MFWKFFLLTVALASFSWQGWWTILRLYSPLPPFLDNSWRPGEVELVR